MTERSKVIKRFMKINKHKKTDLARLLGITRITLVEKLAGRTSWKNKELQKLAEIYETDIETFY